MLSLLLQGSELEEAAQTLVLLPQAAAGGGPVQARAPRGARRPI